MKALLLTDHRRLEVTDVPEPDVGPHDILIAVKACGICGSDVHGYDGSSGRRIPPIVMGHEAAGTVARVGDAVTRFSAGDRVTFDSTIWCGTCDYCRQGKINLCDRRQVLGVSCGDYRRHGAFAEYVVVPEWIVYALPDDVPFEHAALIEAISVAVHAVDRTPTKLGDTAVIVGGGMIGLLVLQALGLAGCSTRIVVDLEPTKLEMAKRLGADHTIRAGDDVDVPQAVRELTSMRGADVAVEAVGLGPTIETAIESVCKGGHVTLVGNLRPEVPFPLQSVVTRELTVAGSCASQGEYPACIELLARRKIDVDPLITARVSLAEGPQWFDRLYAGEPGAMKVVLQPDH